MFIPLRLHYPSFNSTGIMETIWNLPRLQEPPQQRFDDLNVLPMWEINLAWNVNKSGLVSLPDELLCHTPSGASTKVETFSKILLEAASHTTVPP
ncbi:hypothetical protein Landi51_10319 [Colletotrichum acutatum]